MKRTTKSTHPTHSVFVVEGEGETAFWTRIGTAWPHKDGSGFNLQLSAMPVAGRLVIRKARPQGERGAAR